MCTVSDSIAHKKVLTQAEQNWSDELAFIVNIEFTWCRIGCEHLMYVVRCVSPISYKINQTVCLCVFF